MEHEAKMIPAAGYLRSIRLVFDGVATTGGPFYHERKRYRRAANTQIRCSAVWDRRCQRKRNHGGLHWWRHRKRDAWWGEPDYPFSLTKNIAYYLDA